MTRTLLKVSSVPRSSHGAPVLFIWRKMALSNFALTSEASLKLPERPITHFCSFLTLLMHQEKHESTQNRPPAHYHLIRVAPRDKLKTASRLLWFLRMVVMPEGLLMLCSFSTVYDNIFADMINVIVIIYWTTFSSIPTTFRTQNSCKEVLIGSTLTDCCRRQMRIPHHFLQIPRTCCPRGLTMAPYKVQISRLSRPWKVKDIQSFLGFANSITVFIFRYSEITVPLTHLTHKVPLGTSPMSAVQPLKHLEKAFPQLLSLTHWILDTQISQNRLLNYALTGPFLQHRTANCTPLRSTPGLFLLQTQLQHPQQRKSLRFFWSFQMMVTLPWSSGLPMTCHRSPEPAIFSNDQNPHALTSMMVKYLSSVLAITALDDIPSLQTTPIIFKSADPYICATTPMDMFITSIPDTLTSPLFWPTFAMPSWATRATSSAHF